MSDNPIKENGEKYNIENFTKMALPMLRKSFGPTTLDELIQTQPMNAPSGNIFASRQRQAEEIEYEEVYETLPESDENSIQVGEGWGPRVIGRKAKDLTFKFDEVIVGDFLLPNSPT